jgi:hypothetical protein
MKNNQLNRVLNLVRHTGDRVVVLDSENDDVLVVMHLADYESLLKPKSISSALSSKEIYNREMFSNIADRNDAENLGENNFGFKNDKIFSESVSRKFIPQINEVSRQDYFSDEDPFGGEGWWEKDTKTESSVEEKLDDLPEEEEKFYLEPVDEV